MTDQTLVKRLRHGATNIHSIGPALNSVRRRVLYSAYNGGHAIANDTQAASTALPVSTICGFTHHLDSNGKLNPISASNPKRIRIGQGGTETYANVIAASFADATVPFGRGTLTLEAVAAFNAGDAIVALDASHRVAMLEKNALPKGADGMFRIPRFDDPDVKVRLAEHERTGRAFSEVFAREMTRETEFERAQRLAMNTSADRAMLGKTGSVDFKRAGEESRKRREVVASASGQAGYLEVGQPGWRSSAPVLKRKKPRPAKSPEARAEQRQRKAAKAKQRARRGWA